MYQDDSGVLSSAMRTRSVVAAVVSVGLLLAGCGAPKKDTAGCLLVQDRYGTVVSVMERWQYGNATNPAMLDAIQDLQSSADYQQQQAKSAELKAAAGRLSTASAGLYRAVNTGVGFDSAASAVADAKKTLNNICG